MRKRRLPFMDPLVLSIAVDEKTVTRRLTDPKIGPGDTIEVCEALVPIGGYVRYRADELFVKEADTALPYLWPWQVRTLIARYCPAWAIRYRCEVVSVRAEPLSAIDDADAVREGIKRDILGLWGLDLEPRHRLLREAPRDAFLDGFRELHGLAPDADPTVFRIEFRRLP